MLAVGNVFTTQQMDVLTRINTTMRRMQEMQTLIREMESCIQRLNYYTGRGVRILYDSHRNLAIEVPTDATDEEIITEQIGLIDIELLSIRSRITHHFNATTRILNDINILPNIETFPEDFINSVKKISE